MSCTSSILLATLNQGWCKVKGENEWNAQRRINTLEANLWSRVQSVNLWSNLKSESYLFQGRSRMESKNQKGRQFLHRPRGQQSLHCPDILRKEQQLSHRSQIQNKKFWKCTNAGQAWVQHLKKAGKEPEIGLEYEWRRIQRPPFLSHSQLLGGWVG